MRVALVRPCMDYLVNPRMYGPIGLWSLAAYLRRELPDCRVTVTERPDPIPDADIIGWTASSIDYVNVVEEAHAVMQDHPEVLQVLGGPHASAMPNDIDPVFDAVFVGEGEVSFARWVRDVSAGKVRERIVQPEPVANLNDLPFPARSYLEDSPTLVGSRGCPYKCPFCATQTLWPKFRSRSPHSLADEMERLAEDGASAFNLSDDTPRFFASSDARVLADRIEKHGFWFRAQARIDQVVRHPERLADVKRAGCTELCLGVESFDPVVLDRLQKGTNPKMIREAIRFVRESGIRVRAYLMIGTPGETPETVDRNIAALEEFGSSIDVVNLQPFMPLPGTPIWLDPARYGVKIIDPDWSRYNRYLSDGDGRRATWSPIDVEGMTHDQLLRNIARMRDYLHR